MEMCGARWYVWSTVVCVEHGGMCGARWYVWSTVVCVEHGGMCGVRWYVWSTVVCVEHGGMCGARWYVWSTVVCVLVSHKRPVSWLDLSGLHPIQELQDFDVEHDDMRTMGGVAHSPILHRVTNTILLQAVFFRF